MTNIWEVTKLSEILMPVSRPFTVNPMEEYRLLGIRLDGGGVFHRETKTGSQSSATTLFRVQAGDFIYSRLFAWRGAFGVIRSSFNGYYVSSEFPTFMPIQEKIDIDFLRLWFLLPTTIGIVEADCSGSTPLTRNRFKEHFFLNLEIPLPPLAEQRRIVARIEELAAKVEEARGLRKETEEEIEMIRASASKEFFVAEKHPDWPTVALGDATEIRSGVTLGRMLNGPTVRLPYLRVANVQDGYLNLQIIKEIDVLESEANKWLLQLGDVLLTEGGDWDKLGRGAVWRGEIPKCIHQNHIFRVRAKSNEFDPDFLATLISSPYGKSYFQTASKQTTNLASINRRQLSDFKIFRPPLSEQRCIVAYLDDLQARVDAVRQLQAETQGELDGLLPSILDKAFRGELV